MECNLHVPNCILVAFPLKCMGCGTPLHCIPPSCSLAYYYLNFLIGQIFRNNCLLMVLSHVDFEKAFNHPVGISICCGKHYLTQNFF